MITVRRCLISVYDKDGIIDFARFLAGRKVEIISTGGTARHLRDAGILATEIETITGFSEMLGGRVKTLHPAVHAGILASRSDSSHIKELSASGVLPIDMVVVNLYPFEDTVRKKRVGKEEVIEHIDIGGPAMVRSAAKNCGHVAAVTSIRDYAGIMKEMEELKGSISEETAVSLAAKAFALTAQYDSAVASYFSRGTSTHKGMACFRTLFLSKQQDLRYGENPHQKAALYTIGSLPGDAPFRALCGKEISYNNILDIHTATGLLDEFQRPACVIIKHQNPCGVAVGNGISDAYKKSLSTDPLSSYGSVVAVNRPLDSETAKEMESLFIEVLIAPKFSEGGIDVFRAKKNMRLVEYIGPDTCSWQMRSIGCRMLVQDNDDGTLCNRTRTVTVRKPDEEEKKDLLFAWIAVKHAKSNAIVIAKDERTLGIGAGQVSRIEALETAVKKARKQRFDLRGCVIASDAFFPFRDSIDLAAGVGVSAIIQPGGSLRDAEIIGACDEHGIGMIFTGIRHFRH